MADFDSVDDARDVLRDAAVRLAEASATGPGEASPSPWRGLAASRWSLVDTFERDGRRYVVAEQTARTDAEALSPRERAVLTAAAADHHDKLIAYDLGLADSTVRVLLYRATRKLGAKNRSDAIARFRAATARREA